MSPACTMAGYPKTFCTASLPLGLDPQEGLRSAIKKCSSETSKRVALRRQALKHWQRTAGLATHYQVSYQDSRAEERGAVGREEGSQAAESRDRGSPLGRQRLHMQQLQQGLPFKDRLLQPRPALRLYHGLTSTGANSIVSRDRRMPIIIIIIIMYRV